MLKLPTGNYQILSNVCKTGKYLIALRKINSMVIERTPEINKEDLFEAITSPPNIQIEEIVEKSIIPSIIGIL